MTATTTSLRTATANRIATTGLRRVSLIIGAIATVVSLIGSWIPSLWGDEAASVLSATRPVGSLFAMLGHVDAVHGTYYLGLHAWIDLVGASPFAVRLPSAFAIGVCAAAVTWLCGRYGSLRFAALGGILAAVLPRLTYAGEEARAYAFDAAIAASIAVLLGEMLLRRAITRRWWVVYGALLALGIYAFLYLGLMALVAGAVVVATPHLRGQLRRWMLATGAALVLALPVVVFALGERRQVAFLAHRAVVTPDAVLVQMWFGSVPVAVVAGALIVLAIAAWIRDAVRRRGDGAPWQPRVELIAVAWLVLPMGILVAASPLVAGYTARYGTFAAPAAAVLMAAGIRRLARRRWAAVAALVAVAVTVAPVWIAQRGPYAKNGSDWNALAATVAAHARAGDGIVFDEGVRPSRRPRLAMSTDPAAFVATRDLTVKTPYAQGVSWHDTAYTVTDAAALGRFTGVDRVWVVEYAIGGRPDTWGERELRALGYRPTEQFDQHRSAVILYER
jgi:mannosyltransferase